MSDVSLRVAARDASHFLVYPREYLSAPDVTGVQSLFDRARDQGRAVTFRSGGTSLSGQAQGADILVDTRSAFRHVDVLNGGKRVRVGPGATLRAVNNRLAPFGRRLGPDPASEVAATIGGVIANNSSGMTCGTEFNAYRTVESLVVVLPSGTVIDTGQPDADEVLRAREPDILRGLLEIRERLIARPSLRREIERQFSRKNTMGYGLNAFLDEERPSRILTKLMVGSEGTLGFVAEAVFRTLPVRGHVGTALLTFRDVETAAESLESLAEVGPAAIELMDPTSIRVASENAGSGSVLARLSDGAAGLLVEFQEEAEAILLDRLEQATELLPRLPLLEPAEFTREPGSRTQLWHIRKGLYATVAAARPRGTTALLEDIAVPVPRLAETCQSLMALMGGHAYDGGVIFGHAKDGNLHFMLTESFNTTEGQRRFRSFTDDLVDLVLGAGGTLKAEHGTGRMMAPFVRRQYGDELYEMMLEVKALFDPQRILNPGVLISGDPTIHVTDLKTSASVREEVDRCVDCGYCEPGCPSRDLTLTPRQRIAHLREVALAATAGDEELGKRLLDEGRHSVVDTCAADGMCATACPLGIDTGAMVKQLREEASSAAQQRVWSSVARHWAGTTMAASRALSAAGRFPRTAQSSSRWARRLVGMESVPLWDPTLPTGGPKRRPHRVVDPVAVFMPACVGSMFGPERGYPGSAVALMALCGRVGIEVEVPDGVESACCGTPFASKGMTRAHEQVRGRMEAWLWRATDRGRLPVVVDAASCTEGLTGLLDRVEVVYGHPLIVIDALTFTRDTILPRLPQLPARLPSLTVHLTCSTARLGLSDHLLALAGEVADEVHVPADWGCCGFAGDRGMLHPELTASATAIQADQVRTLGAAAHASANRTCEIGMTRATGQNYVHVIEQLAIAHGLFPSAIDVTTEQ